LLLLPRLLLPPFPPQTPPLLQQLQHPCQRTHQPYRNPVQAPSTLHLPQLLLPKLPPLHPIQLLTLCLLLLLLLLLLILRLAQPLLHLRPQSPHTN
jgi:hypothetical protein